MLSTPQHTRVGSQKVWLYIYTHQSKLNMLPFFTFKLLKPLAIQQCRSITAIHPQPKHSRVWPLSFKQKYRYFHFKTGYEGNISQYRGFSSSVIPISLSEYDIKRTSQLYFERHPIGISKDKKQVTNNVEQLGSYQHQYRTCLLLYRKKTTGWILQV